MLTLLFGGKSREAAFRATAAGTLTLRDLVVVDGLAARRCARCLAGAEPCPLFVHDDAAFDAYGFLQAALPGDADALLQPYTGVLPQRRESPQLRQALEGSALRCLYPYPCWPLCDTLQRLEDGLSEAAVGVLRSYQGRVRRAYLLAAADDPAHDEDAVRAARAAGLDARAAVARVTAAWLSKLPLPVMVPRAWPPEGAAPVDLAVVQGGVVHALVLTPEAASAAAAAHAAGWRVHQVSATAVTPAVMDELLETTGIRAALAPRES